MDSHKISSLEDVETYLKNAGITFKTVRHETTPTNEIMKQLVKFEGEHANTVLAKTLFMHDKKKKENMWLICAGVDTELDLKAVNKWLKVASGNLRGADEESLSKFLGCRKGMVNFFGTLNDTDKNVKVLFDKTLYEAEWCSFHPMDNTGSTAINKAGIDALVKLQGRNEETFQIVDFAQVAAENGAGGAAKGGAKPNKPKPQQGKKLTAEEKKQRKEDEKKTRTDGHELSILYKKHTNFSKWYQEVITKAELIDYYDISGCYILRPRSFYIWEQIQSYLDTRFKSAGTENAYFPMFVSQGALEKEKDHLEGFSPEVAWVTKSGQSEMEQPIAIRPTSETIMYPAFAKWIRSHRDLPFKVNQWTNVVRWEFKHPTPFIRTREFLWQEGHTAHADEEDATNWVFKILDYYADVYENLLAVPCVKGKKSDDEKFAGAYFTTSVEVYVPISGRGIQGATSHQLGTNFGKMFDVTYEDAKGKQQYAWQTSWGLSTRSIGTMIMVHSDDQGLVLPPRVAQTQVVIVPIIKKDDNSEDLVKNAHDIADALKQAGVRVQVDDRENYNPGFKFNHWELRGVPVRLELGKKDFEAKELRMCKRHNGEKKQIKQENIGEQVKGLLDEIHNEMFQKALKAREDNTVRVKTWKEFMDALAAKKICLAPWCNVQECEVEVKDRSKEESLQALENEEEVQLTGSAKTLNIPIEQEPLEEGACCFACGKPATVTGLWGRSY